MQSLQGKRGLLDIEPPPCFCAPPPRLRPFTLPSLSLLVSNALLFFNPRSGRGRYTDKLERVKGRLEQREISFKIIQTQKSIQEMKVNMQQVSRQTLWVVFGGDGTIMQIVNFIEKLQLGFPVMLHIVPCGTGNDLFHSFRKTYSVNPLAKQTDAIRFDLGLVKYLDKTTEKEQKLLFTCQVGLGFTADVAKQAQNFRNLGSFKYKMAAYVNFLRNRGINCTVQIDGQKVAQGNIKLFQIQNSPVVGGGVRMCPLAQMDDGLLDIIIGQSESRLVMVNVARKAGAGSHIYQQDVNYYRSERVRIVGEEKGLQFMVDGQMYQSLGPIEISLLRDLVYLV